MGQRVSNPTDSSCSYRRVLSEVPSRVVRSRSYQYLTCWLSYHAWAQQRLSSASFFLCVTCLFLGFTGNKNHHPSGRNAVRRSRLGLRWINDATKKKKTFLMLGFLPTMLGLSQQHWQSPRTTHDYSSFALQ